MVDVQDLSFFPALIVVVVPFITLSIVGMLLARKIIKHPNLSDAAQRGLATISSVTGGLFGLLLGLIVVNLWLDYKLMQEKTIEEAAEIAVIHSGVKQLQHANSDSLQLLVENYLDAIIKHGWPRMAKGVDSKVTSVAFNKFALLIMNTEVEGNGQEYLKQDIMDRVANLYMLRKERLYYVDNPRVPAQIWIVLSIAAAITISTTFLFPISMLKTKIILTLAYSSMIGLILFLIICLNYPFRGAIRVTPEAYIETQKLLKPIKQ